MEGNQTLSLPLDFVHIFKKVVWSQSSFALLAMDTFYQTYLRKRREPNRHLSGRRGRTDVGRKSVCDRKFSHSSCSPLHVPSVFNLTRSDHRKHCPQHRIMTMSACWAAYCQVLRNTGAAQEDGSCVEKTKKKPHTPRAPLYMVFPRVEVTLSSLESGNQKVNNASDWREGPRPGLLSPPLLQDKRGGWHGVAA